MDRYGYVFWLSLCLFCLWSLYVSREYSGAHLTHCAWISCQSVARKRRQMALIIEIFHHRFLHIIFFFHLIYKFYLSIFHFVTPTRSHLFSATLAKASLNNYTLLRFMFHQFAVLSIFNVHFNYCNCFHPPCIIR